MRRFKGIIALDIDGTITIDMHRIEKEVKDFLNFLIDQGWRLIFLTGRTFSFAYPVLSELEGEFYFAVQNGASLYKMPAQELVKKHYLPTTLIGRLPPTVVVESGKQHEDICFYQPDAFSQQELEYIQFRIEISPEKWIAVSSFSDLEITEFAVGKYFADKQKAYAFAEKMQPLEAVKVTVISDPFNPGQFLVFLNDPQATKGRILETFRRMHPPEWPAIAAGDDFNDVEMLKKSTYKIVMQNAPEEMHALADLIAPPAQAHGIINALKEATCYYGRHGFS